jgi:glycosyltransferase involved in cell wall biosynthesis
MSSDALNVSSGDDSDSGLAAGPEDGPRSLALSIIIPAYNEESRLPKTLERIHNYVVARGYPAEIIVVDDGSCDGTVKVVEEERKKYPELRLISNASNQGKGFSVRHGMLKARGEIALFTDADLSAPIEEADKLLMAIYADNYDAAIGSRAMRDLVQVPQSIFRRVAGKAFNLLVRLCTGIRFGDTQCGFKAFRREASRIVFEQQRIEGFGFDPEVLFLAGYHGLQVTEVPVRWAHVPGTKVKVFTDSLRMFRDLVKIRWNALIGAYQNSPVSAQHRGHQASPSNV